MAGRLASIDNANTASASEPDAFIQSALYNATRLALGPFAPPRMRKSTWICDGQTTAITYGDGTTTQITSPQLGNGWSYAYDALDRLISADNDNGTLDDRTFAYDDADNMVFNSGLCAGSPNLVYPPAAAPRPHGPSAICGSTVTYDGNGNTLSYDVDGAAGPDLPRTLVYDGENRLIHRFGGTIRAILHGPYGNPSPLLQLIV